MPGPPHAGLGNQYSDTRAVTKANSDPGGYLRLRRFHRKAAAVARAKIPPKNDSLPCVSSRASRCGKTGSAKEFLLEATGVREI